MQWHVALQTPLVDIGTALHDLFDALGVVLSGRFQQRAGGRRHCSRDACKGEQGDASGVGNFVICHADYYTYFRGLWKGLQFSLRFPRQLPEYLA